MSCDNLSLPMSFHRADGLQSVIGLEGIAEKFGRRPALLSLLHGPSDILLGLLLGSATRRPFAVIDCGTKFNSYTLSRIAHMLALSPRALLRQTYITRSFTAFQTEAAITTKLPHFIARTRCDSVIILGLLDTYYDEQVKPAECRQSLRRILETLRGVARKDIPVLIANGKVSDPPPGKETLFPILYEAAERILRSDGSRLIEERAATRFLEEDPHGTQ